MARKLRRLRITVDEPVRLPDGIIHTGTTYWVSRTIDFSNALIHIENDEVNLRESYFDVELDDTEPLYIKTQYVYNGGLLADPVGSLSNESRISSLRGDQLGLQISDAIVNTPKLDLRKDYSNDVEGELILEGNEFKMYTSVGNHSKSSWFIKDLHGKTLFSRTDDTENLTSIRLPSNITKNTNFIAEVIYYSDTNAISNPGKFYNLKENKKSTLFSVDKMDRLIIGRPLYFKINLKTVKFESYDIVVKNMHGIVVKEFNDLTNLSPKIETSDLNLSEVYTFEFRLDIGNELTDTIVISDIASDKMINYDPNKSYLNQYDYKQLLMSNGKVSQFTYQLYNGTILLTENMDNNIIFYKYVDNKLFKIGDVIDLNVEAIDIPSLYIQELYNGDVLINFKDNDNNVYVNIYDFNPVNNKFTIKHSIILDTVENIVNQGSITTTWDNKVHYVTYDNDRVPSINSFDPYTGDSTSIIIPVTAKTNISIVRSLDDNIVILGGTNTFDTKGNTVYGVRDNSKVLIFNTSSDTFSEIGTDLLDALDVDMHTFHSVLQHDGKIMLFNNLNNGNYGAVDNQSTAIIDLKTSTIEVLENDHADDLLYLTTIVLNNGDVLRMSSNPKDPQKIYGYTSSTLIGGEIDDNDNVVRPAVELIINTDEAISEEYLKQYDVVRVDGNGILKLVKDDSTLEFDSTHLILTRDTVMSRLEFDAGNWSNVVLIDAVLVVKDEDEFA